MKLIIVSIFFVLVSCGFQNEIETRKALFIGQEGIQGFNLDNIEVNSDKNLESFNISKSNAFVRTKLTLSKFSNSQSIEISGRYSDALTTKDIAALESIGLMSPSSSSTKGNLINLTKNPSSDETLAYNIKVQTSLFSDESLSSKLIDLDEGIIYVGGDNHYDAEQFTNVRGENYYLMSELVSNQVSAFELLPEGNYRKILGFNASTTNFYFDEIQFAYHLPYINGHPVGYAYSRGGSGPSNEMHKITNDGSGIKGWSNTPMGVGVGRTSTFKLLPYTINSEPVFIEKHRWSSYSNTQIAIMYWDGSTWAKTSIGDDLKTAIGGTWNNASTITHGRMEIAPDGSVWFALDEFSGIYDNSDPSGFNRTSASSLIRLQYISGPVNVFSSWSARRYPLDVVPNQSIIGRLNALYFDSYQDADNFTIFVGSRGLGRYTYKNGQASYSHIASFRQYTGSEVDEDYPTNKKDANNDSLIPHFVNIEKDISNSNRLILQGFYDVFEYNMKTNSFRELFGKPDGATIIYSR